jgi:nucleoside-diphosphate-sugar epimerase
VLELLELLARHAGRAGLAPETAPARRGELQRNAVDAALAASDLGWRPQMGLERGLELTYETIAAG